jgi:HK97 gp10 family phage protein
MARMSAQGFDNIFAELRALGDGAPAVTEKMVEAGAEVVAESWKTTAESRGLRETGEMIASIAPANPKKGNNATSREVYPQGVGSNGTRNAAKAYIAHYGTSRQKPTYFVDEAERSAEEPMNEAMEAVWDDFIERS